MTESDAEDVLRVVTSRAELLRAIGSAGVEKADLEDELEVSRSTVDRSVRELLDAGLVERDGDPVRLTLAGELALSEYDRFTEQVERALDASDVLATPPGAADSTIDPVVLEGATVHREGAVEALTTLLERATSVEAVVPVSPHERLLDACLTSTVDDQGSTTCVVSDSVLGTLTSSYPGHLERALSTGDVTLSRTTDEPARGIAVVEWDGGEAMALVRYEDGTVAGALTNDSPEAVDWARARFEECRDAAQAVPNPFE